MIKSFSYHGRNRKVGIMRLTESSVAGLDLGAIEPNGGPVTDFFATNELPADGLLPRSEELDALIAPFVKTSFRNFKPAEILPEIEEGEVDPATGLPKIPATEPSKAPVTEVVRMREDVDAEIAKKS